MDIGELIKLVNEPLTQLLVLGVVLLFYALCYSVRLAGGKRRTKKQKIKWSWGRFWDDLHFRLMVAYALGAGVVAVDMAQWLGPLIGVTLSAETASLINANLIISLPFVAGLNELVSGLKLLYKVWKYKENLENLGMSSDSIDPSKANIQQIANDIYNFFDTATSKTSKEDVEGAATTSDDPILDYEQIPDELAGMGGFANTYPEPYRSAAQDSMLDPSTCYNRECVSYCAWKIYELTCKWPKRTGGMNAKYWVQRLAENGYGKIVARPQNGGKYVGVSTVGQYGHVVWFEEENVITEYNYASRGAFSVRVINLNAYTWVEIMPPDAKIEPVAEAPAKKPTTKKAIEYVYKAGDTFGEVIAKLGLKTSHGLWGADGDVAYYTKQLGISGNIPVGTKLVFTKRT